MPASLSFEQHADNAADLRADLRERLVEKREDLIAKLAAAERLDAGWLNLLAVVSAALRAIDER